MSVNVRATAKLRKSCPKREIHLGLIPDLTANKFSVIILNQMVKYDTHSLDKTFAALADPTRRAILTRLAQGDTSVTELAAPFDISLPAISKHLRVLEKAGLLVQEKEGRIRRCHLVAEPLKEAAGWIARYHEFWEEQFGALADYLSETLPNEGEAE